ncbi:MAG: hypothetical protein EOP06_01235 [Proteobacteria bacterium]|nr:MAG: hypothetical protein EOP06_01235 [Pseudomonadota bacterium]
MANFHLRISQRQALDKLIGMFSILDNEEITSNGNSVILTKLFELSDVEENIDFTSPRWFLFIKSFKTIDKNDFVKIVSLNSETGTGKTLLIGEITKRLKEGFSARSLTVTHLSSVVKALVNDRVSAVTIQGCIAAIKKVLQSSEEKKTVEDLAEDDAFSLTIQQSAAIISLLGLPKDMIHTKCLIIDESHDIAESGSNSLRVLIQIFPKLKMIILVSATPRWLGFFPTVQLPREGFVAQPLGSKFEVEDLNNLAERIKILGPDVMDCCPAMIFFRETNLAALFTLILRFVLDDPFTITLSISYRSTVLLERAVIHRLRSLKSELVNGSNATFPLKVKRREDVPYHNRYTKPLALQLRNLNIGLILFSMMEADYVYKASGHNSHIRMFVQSMLRQMPSFWNIGECLSYVHRVLSYVYHGVDASDEGVSHQILEAFENAKSLLSRSTISTGSLSVKDVKDLIQFLDEVEPLLEDRIKQCIDLGLVVDDSEEVIEKTEDEIQSGKSPLLISIKSLATGFNLPSLSSVIMAQAVVGKDSEVASFYRQRAGRARRKSVDGSNDKNFFDLIDVLYRESSIDPSANNLLPGLNEENVTRWWNERSGFEIADPNVIDNMEYSSMFLYDKHRSDLEQILDDHKDDVDLKFKALSTKRGIWLRVPLVDRSEPLKQLS